MDRSYFILGPMEAEIWPGKSTDLFRAKRASPRVKMLSPGRRTGEMDRPEVLGSIVAEIWTGKSRDLSRAK